MRLWPGMTASTKARSEDGIWPKRNTFLSMASRVIGNDRANHAPCSLTALVVDDVEFFAGVRHVRSPFEFQLLSTFDSASREPGDDLARGDECEDQRRDGDEHAGRHQFAPVDAGVLDEEKHRVGQRARRAVSQN